MSAQQSNNVLVPGLGNILLADDGLVDALLIKVAARLRALIATLRTAAEGHEMKKARKHFFL
jgi:hypothetical protein